VSPVWCYGRKGSRVLQTGLLTMSEKQSLGINVTCLLFQTGLIVSMDCFLYFTISRPPRKLNAHRHFFRARAESGVRSAVERFVRRRRRYGCRVPKVW